ncbi:ATP-dependent RNA helicase DBP5 [Plasmodium sp. gorilla clade G3]|nr:ATP-dependent RNA helicase DBP5 [Plasmodium sp. gorilla clade G3]
METQEAPNIESKEEKQNGAEDIIDTNKDEHSSRKNGENNNDDNKPGDDKQPADDIKPGDDKKSADDNKPGNEKQSADDNKPSDKNQPADDNKPNAGSDNVMNMFLNYLQKNKDDPAILQTMMSMMSKQDKNNLSASDLLSFTNSLNKKGEEKCDKNKEEDKKEKGMPGEDLKNPSVLITKIEKNDENISKSENQNINNITTISRNDNKQNNDNNDNINNNNNNVAEKVSAEENNNNSNNNNEEEVVKKKHSVLVEDNDDYEIEETVEPKEPVEEEAISIIENINIDNKEKEKKANDLFSPTSSTIENNNNNDNNKESSDFKLYHSKNTWEELKIDNELIQILTYLKFLGPSKIQAYALPIILSSNKNLIAQSQNGSGKTLTFVIAMLCKINRTLSSLQAVCICPTRELSQQNYDVVCNFTKYLNVKVFLAVPLCERYNKSGGYQIYVGTPGKTLDFLKRKFIDTKNIKLFVLDEADDLIDIKNNMSSQVETIKRFLPRSCQILLFSATYNDSVRKFADQFAPKATKISVRQEDLTLKCVKQYYLITENDEQKYYYLSELYCSMTISQCVIFVNSKKSAYNLYNFMTENNHNVTLICADSIISRFTKNQIQKANVLGMDPKTRDTLMADFKKGISKVLICTDLLSRGIDVPSISLVINFDLPYIYQGRIGDSVNNTSNQRVNMETYIHRIGRTGRFGTKGMAINFISKNQMSHIKQIEEYYKCSIADLEFDSELMITSLTKLKN